MKRKYARLMMVCLASVVLGSMGCPGGAGSGPDGGAHTIGVSVSGLDGTLVVANNGSDRLTITSDGAFTFAAPLAAGQAYDVTVVTQPDGQECVVAGGSGAASADVTVDVSCADVSGFSVGGTVTGLAGTVVLHNGGDTLSVTASGPFRFATRLADGAAYEVTVATQPAGQHCEVARGTGVIAGASVGDVAVTCAARGFRLTNRGITTEAPSVVKAAVHVHRVGDGAPATELTVEDFEVLEDGVMVSPSESFLDLVAIDAVPYALKTVFAIDVSSSLTPANIEQIKRSVRDLIIDPVTRASRLLPGQQVAIYTFDDRVTLRADFTADVPTLLAAVDAIVRGGPSTNLYGAIATGAGRWQDSYALGGIVNGALIVITDGNDTAGVVTKAAAITATRDKQVFAVPVGSEVVLSNLEEIAGASNVVPATDFAQLQATLAGVVERMANFADGLYFLYYASPKRAGSHTLSVAVRGNQHTGADATVTGTFSAAGFANVQPALVTVGPRDVAYATSVTWEVRTRWSNDPANYTWRVTDPDSWVELLELGPTADGKGEKLRIRATGTGCGSMPVTVTDVSRSLTAVVPLTVGCVPVTDVALGRVHACARVVDGTVRCWGNNGNGQLGDGTISTHHLPLRVPGLTDVRRLAAGDFHTCASLADGTVRCWGRNTYGELGDGTMLNNRTTPVTVMGLAEVVDLAAAPNHTCALIDGGTVKCWGSNTYGELGDGTMTQRPTPVAVSGLTDVVQVATGYNQSCALRADGSVRCWGRYGTTNRLTPTEVAGVSGAAQIAMGDRHTCARLTNGTIRCWAVSNLEGQLGDGTLVTNGAPVTVLGIDNAETITGGYLHTCATLRDGRATCWGDNADGQLGDGTTTDRPSPVFVTGLGGAVGISAGQRSTCATLVGGPVRCWGNNLYGQLGDGTQAPRLTPVPALITTR